MTNGEKILIDYMPERVTDDFFIRDGEVDLARLRAAVRSGARVLAEFVGRGESSIAFLEPVIDELTVLWIDAEGTISDLDLLERASSLRMLDISGRVGRLPIDLSSLPVLTEFRAPPRPALESALRNPSLRSAVLWGALPKRTLRIEAPVRALSLHALGVGGTLPTLAHPETLDQASVSGVRSFDVAFFTQFDNLRSLSMQDVKGLTSIASFTELPHLRWLDLKGAVSEEDWSVLDRLQAEKVSLSISPLPPLTLRREWKARGWEVRTDDDFGDEVIAELGPVRVLREPEDGWAEIRVDDVTEFNSAVKNVGGPALANGQAVQDLVRKLVEAEYGPLSDEQVLYDSEASMMSVFFAEDAKAARIAELLSALADR